ncbi:MAG: hypothetical protein JO001_02195 [Alphaproteobacteria bacterium]|nr:hypothetical protein [Alphaproteobacteria bacterium]
MFAAEARWVADTLWPHTPEELSPLLNVGSSTRQFRQETQPWMDKLLFAPLAARGIDTVHLDFRRGDGIDLCVDLLDDDDFARVDSQMGDRRYRSLMCCNILEHVREPAKLARRCVELVAPGGFIVVTVPRSYPRHGDPIDTLYRPTPLEAAALFPETVVLASTIIDVGESYRDEVRRRPLILMRHVARLPVPFLNREKWRHSMRKLYWLAHNYEVTALLLRRKI